MVGERLILATGESLREGFPVAVSDFFDARAAVFIASWVKQYDKHRPPHG